MAQPFVMARQPLAETDSNVNVLGAATTRIDLTKPKPGKATKRKASEIEEPQNLPEIDSDDPRLRYVTDNCDQVRRKIRAYLGSGEMNVGEFAKAVGSSNRSYNTFMTQNGPDKGRGCDFYFAAFRFFKKRELQGLKMPKKKVKKADEDKKNDVSGIHLDGEEEGEVPIFETCDEVRRKIEAHLRDPNVTQAGFLREIAKTFPEERKLQAQMLQTFLSKKGPSAGNTSAIFYASYVFFEKLRLRDGRPKSKHREDMEEIYPIGFDRKRRDDVFFLPAGALEAPYEDKYGQIHFL